MFLQHKGLVRGIRLSRVRKYRTFRLNPLVPSVVFHAHEFHAKMTLLKRFKTDSWMCRVRKGRNTRSCNDLRRYVVSAMYR